MTDKNNILNELAELNSSLAGKAKETAYSVPAGYFDTLLENVMARIKAMDIADAKEELQILSPLVAGLSKQVPYEVPAGYFEQLNADKPATEEVETLSPLLSNLKNKNPYTVPAGYFESLNVTRPAEQPVAKVISIVHRRWFRMAAAAIVTGILVMTGFLIFNNKSVEKAPLAKFTRDVKKMDDAQKDDLIDFIDAGLTGKEQAKTSIEAKSKEIRNLMQDIPANELKDLEQQTEDLADVLMTN
jgi:hypothetical protein